MKAEIELKYEDTKYAEAIAKAVSPDNFKVPLGLSINTENKENIVSAHIKCNKKITTLIATLDDLLSCITTAEDTVQVTKRLK